ncbi:hypothetical protein HY994_06310 [Candidatus Micrarchaeota archaeon]|nr:hypothetical protein [Candidatus Micrarchaeota archaeon]
MEYDKAVKNAFFYARHSKAVLAYVAFAGAVGALLLFTLAILISRFGLNASVRAALYKPDSLSIGFFGIIAVLAVFLLGILGLNGAVIRNATQHERLSESWNRISPRLGTLVAVMLVAAAAGFSVNMVFDGLSATLPYGAGAFFALNVLFSLVLAFFFAFAQYAVVLDGKSAIQSIRHSVKLASEKPIDVLLAVIVSTVTGIIIAVATLAFVLILAITLIFLARPVLAGPLGLVALVIGALVFSLGLFFGEVVKLHIMAHAYLDVDKQKNDAKDGADQKPTPKTHLIAPKPIGQKRTIATKKSKNAPANTGRQSSAKKTKRNKP